LYEIPESDHNYYDEAKFKYVLNTDLEKEDESKLAYLFKGIYETTSEASEANKTK
jgi:hypothetical protein